ncbi:MAG: hypothetical protein B7Z10_00255 [Rhodobacterales bacterium 32-66-7]|nr:MAG: hypothetical protein B7Z10_00255 [Rhodobacterales bacterium 32-66-7]OZA08302.1 MAG: hypothetical protein B7Y02_12755 [Rhodobacterales bacterium 17-64-5]
MTTGVVRSVPNLILRAEGAALLAAASVAYATVGAGWGLFALLFLVPDVFMLGYLRGPRLGSVVYNLGHSTILPVALIGFGLVLPSGMAVSVGLIWLAHVGFDRAAGYGLKYGDAFRHTHLSGPAGAEVHST